MLEDEVETAPSVEPRSRGAAAVSDEVPSRTQSHWLEIASAILLAFATVATAWSGYQSSRWGGVQSIKFSEANAARLESTRASTQAGQLAEADYATFIAWADAYGNGNRELSSFFFERMRPPLKRATQAWLATDPIANASAPPTPFTLPSYRLPQQDEADDLLALSTVRANEAKAANQRSDNYVLAVVLFASALFFAGIATKFASERVKVALVGLGAIAFAGTATWIATFPVTVGL